MHKVTLQAILAREVMICSVEIKNLKNKPLQTRVQQKVVAQIEQQRMSVLRHQTQPSQKVRVGRVHPNQLLNS